MAIGPSLTARLLTSAATRLASRSVPWAIVVTGGLLAKTLYDLRREHARADEAQAPDPADDSEGHDP